VFPRGVGKRATNRACHRKDFSGKAEEKISLKNLPPGLFFLSPCLKNLPPCRGNVSPSKAEEKISQKNLSPGLFFLSPSQKNHSPGKGNLSP